MKPKNKTPRFCWTSLEAAIYTELKVNMVGAEFCGKKLKELVVVVRLKPM